MSVLGVLGVGKHLWGKVRGSASIRPPFWPNVHGTLNVNSNDTCGRSIHSICLDLYLNSWTHSHACPTKYPFPVVKGINFS